MIHATEHLRFQGDQSARSPSEKPSMTVFAYSNTAPSANLFFSGFQSYAAGTLLSDSRDAEFTMLVTEETLARIWNHPDEDLMWRDL